MNKEEIEEYIWNLSLHGSRWLAEELYKLQQENQKLKKQLEKKYSKTGTLTNEVLYEENTKLINQQKEFIEYLEEKIICYENYQNTNLGEYERNLYFNLYNDILEKFKEIIGYKDEYENEVTNAKD